MPQTEPSTRVVAFDADKWQQITGGASDPEMARRLHLSADMVWRTRTGRTAPSSLFVLAVREVYPAEFDHLFTVEYVAA